MYKTIGLVLMVLALLAATSVVIAASPPELSGTRIAATESMTLFATDAGGVVAGFDKVATKSESAKWIVPDDVGAMTMCSTSTAAQKMGAEKMAQDAAPSEIAQKMTMENMVAAALDVGLAASRTHSTLDTWVEPWKAVHSQTPSVAMPDIVAGLSHTYGITATEQAASMTPMAPSWACGAYAFTRTTADNRWADVADVGRTKMVATTPWTAPPTGVFIGDRLAAVAVAHC